MIADPVAFLMIRTRCPWGFSGVCTYQRGAFCDGWARAVCSDTSTGHGWGGSISAVEWGKHARSAAVAVVPYKLKKDGKPASVQSLGLAEGWMVLDHETGADPVLFPVLQFALDHAMAIMEGAPA